MQQLFPISLCMLFTELDISTHLKAVRSCRNYQKFHRVQLLCKTLVSSDMLLNNVLPHAMEKTNKSVLSESCIFSKYSVFDFVHPCQNIFLIWLFSRLCWTALLVSLMFHLKLLLPTSLILGYAFNDLTFI